MTEKEQQFNQWFDEYANGVKVFEEADMKHAYLQGRAELEKENAELKEYNKYLRRKRQGGIQKQYNKVAIIKQQDEQLANAKEIIKLLLWDLRNRSYEPVKDIERAEQFLKNDGCPDVMCEDCTKEDCEVRQLGLVEKVK